MMNLKTTIITMSSKLTVFPWTTTARSNSNKCVSNFLQRIKCFLCSESRLPSAAAESAIISAVTALHVKFAVTDVPDVANGSISDATKSTNVKPKYQLKHRWKSCAVDAVDGHQ
jgi:hypothetical protein